MYPCNGHFNQIIVAVFLPNPPGGRYLKDANLPRGAHASRVTSAYRQAGPLHFQRNSTSACPPPPSHGIETDTQGGSQAKELQMSYRYRQPKSLRSAQNDFRLWFNANLKEYARDIARQ